MNRAKLGGYVFVAAAILGCVAASAGGYAYKYGHTGHNMGGMHGWVYSKAPARSGHAPRRLYGYPGYVRPMPHFWHGQLPQAIRQQASATTETRAVAAESSDNPVVSISGMKYGPSSIEVKTGDTVTWNSSDRVPHTITSRTGDFASSSIGAGETFQHQFDEAGEYEYYCSIHPNMTGKVVVE